MTTIYELQGLTGKFSTPEQIEAEKRARELEIANKKLEEEAEELRRLIEEMSREVEKQKNK